MISTIKAALKGDDTMWWILATGVAVLVGYVVLRFSKKTNSNTAWPVVPGARPFLGNDLGKEGLGGLNSKFEEWINTYGNIPSNETGVLECSILGQVFLLVCNNSFALELVKLRPNKLRRPRVEIEAIRSVGADGVFSAEGDIWRSDRRIISPPLNQKNLKDYLPFLRTVTERLVQKWEDECVKGPVAINQDMLAYPIDIIGLVAFDQDYDSLRRPDSQEASDLRHMFARLTTRAMSPIWYWRIPFIGNYLDGAGFTSGRLRRGIRNTIRSYESESRDKDCATRSRTYLDKILRQHAMDEERVMGNLMTMFAAGSETTGNTLVFCFWELVNDTTGLMGELVEEVMALDKIESDATFQDIMEGLPKLRAFFYEVVRLTGTAPALFLEAAEEVTVGKLSFPAGSTFYLNGMYLGKQDDGGVPKGPNGEPPAVFCSRRWLSRDETSRNQWSVTKPSPKAGVSLSSGFGNGVRICPGQDFAEIEVVYCLACILKRFQVSILPDHPPMRQITSFTQSPNVDIQLCLKPRR